MRKGWLKLPQDVIDTLKRLKKELEIRKWLSVVRNAVNFYSKTSYYVLRGYQPQVAKGKHVIPMEFPVDESE